MGHLPSSLDESLNLSISYIFMVLEAFPTRHLERNLGNTLNQLLDDIAIYGMHSIKSGAASNPVCRSISADLLDMHHCWTCAISENRYMKHTVNDCLKVARSIAL